MQKYCIGGYCYTKKLGLANGKAAANLLRREKRKGISNIPKHRNEKLKATRSPDRKARKKTQTACCGSLIPREKTLARCSCCSKTKPGVY